MLSKLTSFTEQPKLSSEDRPKSPVAMRAVVGAALALILTGCAIGTDRNGNSYLLLGSVPAASSRTTVTYGPAYYESIGWVFYDGRYYPPNSPVIVYVREYRGQHSRQFRRDVQRLQAAQAGFAAGVLAGQAIPKEHHFPPPRQGQPHGHPPGHPPQGQPHHGAPSMGGMPSAPPPAHAAPPPHMGGQPHPKPHIAPAPPPPPPPPAVTPPPRGPQSAPPPGGVNPPPARGPQTGHQPPGYSRSQPPGGAHNPGQWKQNQGRRPGF